MTENRRQITDDRGWLSEDIGLRREAESGKLKAQS